MIHLLTNKDTKFRNALQNFSYCNVPNTFRRQCNTRHKWWHISSFSGCCLTTAIKEDHKYCSDKNNISNLMSYEFLKFHRHLSVSKWNHSTDRNWSPKFLLEIHPYVEPVHMFDDCNFNFLDFDIKIPYCICTHIKSMSKIIINFADCTYLLTHAIM